jgi:hypothetical protein
MSISVLGSGSTSIALLQQFKTGKDIEKATEALIAQLVGAGQSSDTTTEADSGVDFRNPVSSRLATLLAEADATTSASGAEDEQSSASFVSDVATLIDAVRSGDMDAAQAAAESLLRRSSQLAGDGPASFLADLQSLVSAVQSGDVSGAQEIAGQIVSRMKDAPPPPSASAAWTFVSDLATLHGAVRSNDVTTQQSSVTSLESDLETLLSPSGDSATGSSTIRNDLKNLIASAKTGDAASAQSNIDTLLQDILARGDGGTSAAQA